MSVADREMTASKSKSGFDIPGRVLGRSDLSYDTQLALAISASLNEGISKHTCVDSSVKVKNFLSNNWPIIAFKDDLLNVLFDTFQ